METGRKKVRLGELLVNSGVLTNEQLQQALDNPNRQGKKLGEFLVDEGIVSEDDLAKALSRQLDLDMIDLQSVNVDKEVLNLVPVNVLKKNKIFPFAYKENNFNVLMVAMADPLDYNAIDDINIITNFQVEPVVATTRSIMLAIDKYWPPPGGNVTEEICLHAISRPSLVIISCMWFTPYMYISKKDIKLSHSYSYSIFYNFAMAQNTIFIFCWTEYNKIVCMNSKILLWFAN